MNILQVSTSDVGGGAEKVALDLMHAYQRLNCDSYLAVGFKKSTEPKIIQTPSLRPKPRFSRLIWAAHGRLEPYHNIGFLSRVRNLLWVMGAGVSEKDKKRGHEDFNFIGSEKIDQLIPAKLDVIHVHNLHGGYFDLRKLPIFANKYPVFVTLHDQWSITGHCAYTMGCEKWANGCGKCPDLTIYPSIERDATAWNWRRKKKIFGKSRLFIATPSQWLMDCVERSMLKPSEKRVIPYGVDLTIFHPASRAQARKTLDLSQEKFVLLFTAQSGKNNPFKDFATIENAVNRLARNDELARRLTLVVLGGSENRTEQLGNAEVKLVSFLVNPQDVARYYQAANVYLHAANADNFPCVILESLACGTPVIATAVGGIPEQISHGETGFLVPARDDEGMADFIAKMIEEPGLATRMSESAAKTAVDRFDLNQQANTYLDWYRSLIFEQ